MKDNASYARWQGAHVVLILLLVFLGLSVLGQPTNEFALAKTEADKGDLKAQYEVAKDYFQGKGVERDYVAGARYLRMSAEQGHAFAQTELAACYAKGRGVTNDFAEAAKWYRKASDQEDPMAQLGLGNLYLHGQGVEKDTNQALDWWRKAAEQNLAEAKDALGQYYFKSASEDPQHAADYAAAAKWLLRASEQGFVPSMNNLAYLYERGFGVAPDFQEAFRWYKTAAEKGSPKAQSNLGLIYEQGTVVPQDFVQAYKWFKLAAMQNDPVGKRYVQDYNDGQRLTEGQMEEVDRLIAEFRNQQRTNRPAPKKSTDK